MIFPGGTPQPFNLKAEFQGCADVGVCYPPQEAVAAVKPVSLARQASAAPMQQQSEAALDRLKSLAGNLMSGAEPEFLSPEEAFQVSQLDETYQIEQWGEDYEAADRRTELAADIAAAGRFLELLAE